jgi:uncharacterized protein (TIGR02246 family)
MRKYCPTLLPLIVLVVACQPAGTERFATTSTEADLEALRELVRQYDAGVNAGHLDGLVALYAADAVQMPPDEPVVVGQEAIRSRGESFFAQNTDEVRSAVEDVQVSGDWAFLRMSYTESWTPRGGGETTAVVGKWLLICRRQADGTWRITNEIWNEDKPRNRG